jgi:hypothetical protein
MSVSFDVVSTGATGVRTKNREGDETGTLNVILVVILPVAQMILVLMIISILRILYCKYCKKQYDDPKLLQVVSSAKKKNEHQILLKTSIPRLQTDTNGKNKH